MTENKGKVKRKQLLVNIFPFEHDTEKDHEGINQLTGFCMEGFSRNDIKEAESGIYFNKTDSMDLFFQSNYQQEAIL